MNIKHIYENIKLILSYLISNLVKNPRTFKIGFVSIFLVVFFISFMMNAISISSVIFTRLTEETVGEADIVMIPFDKIDVSKNENEIERIISMDEIQENKKEFSLDNLNFPFLNFTDLFEKLKDEEYLQGIVPRWIFPGVNSSYVSESGFNYASSNLLIIDSSLENKFLMGRKLQLPKLLSFECYVSDTLYKSLKIQEDYSDEINLHLDLSSLFQKLIGKSVNKSPEGNNLKQNDEANVDNKRNNSTDSNKREKMKIKESQLKNILKQILGDRHFTYRINQSDLMNMIENNKFLENNLNFSDPKINELIKLLQLYSKLSQNNLILDVLFDKNSKIEVVTILLQNLIASYNLTNIFSIKNIASDNSIEISLNLSQILNDIPDELIDSLLVFDLPLKIKFVVNSSSGKWSKVLGNVIAIDSNSTKSYLITHTIEAAKNYYHKYLNTTEIDKMIEKEVNSFFDKININDYAMTANAIIKDKFSLYSLERTYQRQSISKISGQIIKKLGYNYSMRMILPIYDAMDPTLIVKIFLDNIFYSILLFLWILSFMLIYSLILGNVDEKTYEFGMLRALGFKKSNLILMVVIQSMIFSIPAIIVGLKSSYVANVLISYFLFTYSGIVTSYDLNWSTMLWSSVTGFSIPLISSYFPIKKALSENLKEALQIFNKKLSDILVSIVKLEKLGISPSSFLFSSILIIMGFATYYIVPLSYFLMDSSIVFFILNFILIMMIIGMVFMLQIFVPKIQRIILDIIMLVCYKDKNVKFVVIKNMEGHARRNQKTSIMFMVALSFLIFSGCSLKLIGNFIGSIYKNIFASDIWINTSNDDGLDQNSLINYLQDFDLKFPNNLKNYTFLSKPLDHIVHSRIKFSSICGYSQENIDVIAVDENFLNSIFYESYIYKNYDKNLNFTHITGKNKIDIISGLYLNENLNSRLINDSSSIVYPDKNDSKNIEDLLIIIPQGIKDKYSVDTNHPARLQFYSPNTKQTIYPARIIAQAIKFPGFPLYSSYYALARNAPILISTRQMKKIIDRENLAKFETGNQDIVLSTNTPDGIPKNTLFIKFFDLTTSKIKEMVYFELKNYINNDNTQAIFVSDYIDSANLASFILEIFFLVVGVIAIILAFFQILISFYCNIKDNILEYGIMRALGISKSQSMRIYLYEAAVLIITSIILGSFIGIVISTTLILQFNIFSELPFEFSFPFYFYLVMCIAGIVLGLLGSYYPIKEVNQHSLVKIMKGIYE